MGKECIAFQILDAKEAWQHMNCEIVKDYGDYADGHLLYTWDDDYYTDYFPVSGTEEAE